ncbi:hypothetical protein Bhyg_14252 [Pseudolycoriella hygida]|uniref:Uncharacterized protein n=1 Tax=Pseudolycoriella hygida TaxID=35572 RepID=A0A9Q0RX37_9DIPT|nr:hypothetical protein Bhyg_14252 [Pseudolycoriella hygida]
MAPSPELGQAKPKAPDKVDTKQYPIDGTNNEVDLQKSSNATQQDSENLGSWGDTELKKLLDEAFTYKRPKDREHKSEIFRELLQNVEQEDKIHHNSNRLLGRPVRGSNRHTQGGSLQDLVETVKLDQLLESDGLIGNLARRQHNSRQKKYSSVSTRQREGGSLPSNVNCNPYEDQFSNDFGKRGVKNEKSILMSGSNVTRPDTCFVRTDDLQQDRTLGHTIVQIDDGITDDTAHLLAHDSLAQDTHSSDEGTELNPMKRLPRLATSHYTSHQYLNLEMMEASRIDKTVQFNSLKNGSKPTDMNAIQLNKSYVAVNSCIDSNSMSGLPLVPGQNTKFATYHHPHNIHLIEQKNTDENGNAVHQSFNSTLPSGQLTKKDGKKKKTERNIKSTIAAKDIEGNRGDDNIEDLVSFIENDDTHKNGVINNNVSKRMLALDKKGKKGGTDNKKENTGNNKLKKYNSMENLKSASKLEEENAQSENGRESNVVLRHKQQMKKTTEMKESSKQQQQQKRGERRSWGTEELTYLGDANSIVKEVRENDAKEIRKAKDHQKANKKKDEPSECLVSSESLQALNETAEFHVVTKKRKPKKKQEEIQQKPLYQCPSQHSHVQGNRLRYQNSQNYSNDRDPYFTPLKFKRRKSTSSSMPPSEKSDSSDVDSVHSLPIESSSRTNNVPPTPSSTGNNTSPASYAEIARISQQNKQSILSTSFDKWPTVSNGKNPESPDNSNMSTCSTLSAKSQSSLRGNKFFPEANEMSHPVQEPVSPNGTSSIIGNATRSISYSQSLTDDKQSKVIDNGADAKSVNVEASSDSNPKNPLQKSKSVDNDNYVNMNIDQYPALEKTVKPQKQYQSMPAVQINNNNNNNNNNNVNANVVNSSTKSSSKSTKLSSQSQSSPIVKQIESSTSHPSKKTKLTPTNAAQQSASKEVQSEFEFNHLDENLNNKPPPVEMCDLSFCTTFATPPPHTSSTTKKSVKRDKANQHTATQNHLNFDRNRPAVIILDNNNKFGHNVSPLLFGDFNEDEVRQWDQDSDQPFIMATNHHYDQATSPSSPQQPHEPMIQSNEIETAITNDQFSSSQSDLGYCSSVSRNAAFSCDYSTIHDVGSSEQTIDVASDQMQSNVKCSNSCSDSIGLDQVNNNVEVVDADKSSASANNASDVIVVKEPTGREKVTVVCGGNLKLRYVEPLVLEVELFHHARLVDFIGLEKSNGTYSSQFSLRRKVNRTETHVIARNFFASKSFF